MIPRDDARVAAVGWRSQGGGRGASGGNMGVERKRIRLPDNLTVFFFLYPKQVGTLLASHCWHTVRNESASRRRGFRTPGKFFCVSHHIARRASAGRFSIFFFHLFSPIVFSFSYNHCEPNRRPRRRRCCRVLPIVCPAARAFM